MPRTFYLTLLGHKRNAKARIMDDLLSQNLTNQLPFLKYQV